MLEYDLKGDLHGEVSIFSMRVVMMSKACRRATDMSPLVSRSTDLDQPVAGLLRVDLLGHGVGIAGLFEVSIFLHTSPPLAELLLQRRRFRRTSSRPSSQSVGTMKWLHRLHPLHDNLQLTGSP